jgi:hypothetical protein
MARFILKIMAVLFTLATTDEIRMGHLVGIIIGLLILEFLEAYPTMHKLRAFIRGDKKVSKIVVVKK